MATQAIHTTEATPEAELLALAAELETALAAERAARRRLSATVKRIEAGMERRQRILADSAA